MSAEINTWIEAIGYCYTADAMRRVLGMTGEELDEARRDLRVLALDTGVGVTLYPSWQVLKDHVLRRLPEVLTILRTGVDDPWTWAKWLVFTPPPDDVHRSPIDKLRGGQTAQVIRHAEHVARTWHSDADANTQEELDDTELIAWVGDGYPPRLQRILDRQPPMWAALAVGRGWWPLLARLDAQLAELDPDYTISQVKEKLGGLNYNASTTLTGNAKDDFDSAVRRAEREADVTCEVCGNLGGLLVNRAGSYRILCENHSTGFQRVNGTTTTKDPAALQDAEPFAPTEGLIKVEMRSASAGGVPPEIFTKAGRIAADKFVNTSATAVRAIQGNWPSARDVSTVLRVDEADLRRRSDAGELSTAEVDGVLRVAPWQLSTEGQLLPRIPEVLKAVPPEYTALAVQTVMTTPNEVFDELEPRELLKTSGGAKKVLEWATELGLS